MAKYIVAGAGDEGGSRENPPVHSKGQRHGMPFHPTPVSTVGGVASPPPGAGKVIHRSATPGSAVSTHYPASALGSQMAEGKHSAHGLSSAHTDTVSQGGSGKLDSQSYTGARKGVAK